VFPCTEQGIRDAIAAGGGPYTFDCDGPTTITIGSTIGIDNDVTLDGEGDLTVESPPAYWDLQNSPDDPFLSYPVFSVGGVTAELIGITATGGRPWGLGNAGTLRISQSNIVGNGQVVYEFAIPGGGEGGINNTGDLTVADSSVSGNDGQFSVGGIHNAGGTVTVVRSQISGNVNHAIRNSGALTIRDSTISGNFSHSDRYGQYGGYTVWSSGTLLIANSTIAANFSDDWACGYGLGVIRGNGSGIVINSTVSRNSLYPSCVEYHLAWAGPDPLEVINSTVAGEMPLIGSGVRVTNSIIAEDPAPFLPPQCGGSSGGGNIESPGDTCGFDQPTDQVNVSADDLKLGPLADNGGPTMTHALLPDSVAINWIPQAMCLDAAGDPLTTDQRGEPRDSMCDVGAFEVQP
jgi:hypothetical protein